MTLGIVGLGLMGGSLSLAVREKKLTDLVIGFDTADQHKIAALELGIVDAVVSLDELLRRSDVLVLAIPVEAIVSLMPKLISFSGVIIDLGSTKTEIVKAIPSQIRSRFVATHPMAGTEYSGPKAAFSKLYENRIIVMCNTEANDKKSLDTASSLFESIGMKIVQMDAKDHDRHAAFISHMPHMISYALANSVLNQEDKQSILTLAAGGFRDMSRLAKSSSTMWIDIFKQNKTALLESLTIFTKEFESAKELIRSEKWQELKSWMSQANTLHDIFKPKV